jgi:CRISPR-associated protein Cas5d
LRSANLAGDPFTEDLGLMLYDVFNWQERGEGFRWLREDEIANSAMVSPRTGRQPRAGEKVVRHKGQLITPAAAFFHARVERSRLDCHPERVRILTTTTGEN